MRDIDRCKGTLIATALVMALLTAPAAQPAGPPEPPATPPQPASAPPQPASTTSTWTQGQTAALRLGAVVRTRPLAASDPVSTPPDVTVTLSNSVSSAGGRWWHVTWEGGAGWVREHDLQ